MEHDSWDTPIHGKCPIADNQHQLARQQLMDEKTKRNKSLICTWHPCFAKRDGNKFQAWVFRITSN